MFALTLKDGTGANLAQTETEIYSIQINYEVNRIPFAEVVLNDNSVIADGFTKSALPQYALNKIIQIRINPNFAANNPGETILFEGVIVSQKVSASVSESRLTLVLKDIAVKMTHGNKYKIFDADKTDKLIICELINSYSNVPIDNKFIKAGNVEQTKPVHKSLVQYACTDWDFIVSRAESNGMFITVDKGAVSAKLIASPKAAADVTISCNGTDNVISFEVETNNEYTYRSIIGDAWDSTSQGRTTVINTNLNQVNKLSPGDLLSTDVALNNYELDTSAQLTLDELKSWADGKMARSQLSLIRGRIEVEGRIDAVLLNTIGLQGIGTHYNGNTLITGVCHRFTAGSWTTDIQFGLSDEWLLQKTQTNNLPASGLLPAISGLHIGIVENLEDPDNQFRVLIKLQSSVQNNEIKLWARLASPDAGNGRGYFFRPEIGDEVIVGFINDDPRQAIILGSLYSSEKKPPQKYTKIDNNNYKKGIVSKKGMSINIEDQHELLSLNGPIVNEKYNYFFINNSKNVIAFGDKNGNYMIMNKDGIKLKSCGDITIDVNNGNNKFNSNGANWQTS